MIGRKGLLALVALTVVVGLAAWGLRARSQTPVETLPERVFPGLAAQLNELTGLMVTGHDESFHLHKTGEAWGMDEKDGHPVRFERLKGLLVALSELKPLERKTASPSLHAKLGLQAPGDEGSSSVQVTALGAGGAPVADLIVGRPGPAARTRYVRKAGEDQTWLVQGELNADASAQMWVDTEIMRLQPADVAHVTTTHADGEVLHVDKQAQEDPIWTIADVPEGREPKNAGIAATVAGALQWLDFDDVAAAEKRALPESERATTVFETWDGMTITVTAAREPAPAPPPPEPAADGETPPPTPPAPEATDWITITVAAADSAGEDVKTKAAELNARVAPWVYKLGKYKASTLRQHMADLTQPKPEKPPESPEASEPAAPPADQPDG
jgi:hypothetical protein